jgi:hypothetical protein
MEECLADYITKLENENIELKSKLKETQKEVYGWNKLKLIIHEELSTLDLEKTRPYGCFKGKVESAIGQIIRETFDLKFIKNLDSSNYDQGKEITECILKFVKQNFVKDRFFCKDKN